MAKTVLSIPRGKMNSGVLFPDRAGPPRTARKTALRLDWRAILLWLVRPVRGIPYVFLYATIYIPQSPWA